MDIYATELKRKLNEADEADTNKDEVTDGNTTTLNCNPKCRKYNPLYLSLGFTCKVINDQERSMCLLCMKSLAAHSMRQNKLIQHFENLHVDHVGKKT